MSYIDEIYNDKSTEVKDYIKELVKEKKIRIGFARADGRTLVYCSYTNNLIWSNAMVHKIKRR